MAAASTGTTLELRASSLRDTGRGSVPCSGRGGWRSRRDIFRAVCLVTGGARPAGCGPRRPGIRGRGGSRRFSGGGAGTPMHCATPCANTLLRRWPTRTRRWCWTRPVFRKGQDVVRRGAAVHGIGGQGHQLPGVFAFCVPRHGHALTDRGLCPPKAWADDPARLAGAHVPDGTGFATKPAIALSMVGRATGADVPFRRVAADRLCGAASMGKNPAGRKGMCSRGGG